MKTMNFPGSWPTESYRPIEPSRNCISSAMNVGHPSNLARLIALYGGRMDEKGVISAARGPGKHAPRHFCGEHQRRRKPGRPSAARMNGTACCWNRTAPWAGPACRNTWSRKRRPPASCAFRWKPLTRRSSPKRSAPSSASTRRCRPASRGSRKGASPSSPWPPTTAEFREYLQKNYS